MQEEQVSITIESIHIAMQLLIIFLLLLGNAFAENEFGLNFDPPTNERDAAFNKRGLRNLTQNKIPGDKVAKVAAMALQQFAPPELVYGAITKLMEKADRSMDIIDSTEFTTAFGLPCNPNEKKFCFKKTTTTTTTGEPSLFRKRREARPIPDHSRQTEVNDYELPPEQVTDFNQLIAKAREAFDKQRAISQELEAERKKRAFLDGINGESGDNELVNLDGSKFTESEIHSISGYKKNQLLSDSIQRVVGRDAVNLRGWFPDDVWSNPQKRPTVETSRRLEGKQQRRCLKGKKDFEDRIGETSSDAKEATLNVEDKKGDARLSQRANDEPNNQQVNEPDSINGNTFDPNIDASVQAQSNLPFWTAASFWPTLLWEKLMMPQLITGWFYDNEEGDEMCLCSTEDDFDDDYDEPDFDDDYDEPDFDESSSTPEVLTIEVMLPYDGLHSNFDTKDYTRVAPMSAAPFSIFRVSIPDSRFAVAEPWEDDEEEEEEEHEGESAELRLSGEAAQKMNLYGSRLSYQRGREPSNPIEHYARALRTTPMLPNENGSTEAEPQNKNYTVTEQEIPKKSMSHLFRDFRQIPEFFDFVSSMLPPFLQFEEFSILNLFTAEDADKNKANDAHGSSNNVLM